MKSKTETSPHHFYSVSSIPPKKPFAAILVFFFFLMILSYSIPSRLSRNDGFAHSAPLCRAIGRELPPNSAAQPFPFTPSLHCLENSYSFKTDSTAALSLRAPLNVRQQYKKDHSRAIRAQRENRQEREEAVNRGKSR